MLGWLLCLFGRHRWGAWVDSWRWSWSGQKTTLIEPGRRYWCQRPGCDGTKFVPDAPAGRELAPAAGGGLPTYLQKSRK